MEGEPTTIDCPLVGSLGRYGVGVSITGGMVGQRTAPPLLLLLNDLSFNNCFSMNNFALATKRYLI